MAPRSRIIEDEGVALKQVPDAEFQLRQEAQSMGKVGVWFGSRENAALYIAGAITILCVIALFGIAFAEQSPHRSDIAKYLGGALAGALGFIGGLLSGKK